MFSARRQALKIFEHIRVYKVLRRKVKNLIRFHFDFQEEAMSTTEKLKSLCKDIEVKQKILLEDIISLLNDHKQLGKK